MWPNLPMSQPLGPDTSAISNEWPAGSVLSDSAAAQIADFDDASPSSALYNAYVETDTTLQRVRTGAQYICLDDLRDGGLVTRLLNQVAEAVTESQDIGGASKLRRLHSSSNLLAMLAVRKVCELAEHSITVVLPGSSQRNTTPSMGPFVSGYAAPAGAVTTGSPVTQHDPDRVAAMLRVDRHLGRLNAFVTSFTRSTHTYTLADNSSALKVQQLLFHIHTRIRTKVESMVSRWDY